MSDETKWTPGPWNTREPNGPGNGHKVGPAWLGESTMSAQTRADAYLIGAAPELYEALDQAVTSMQDSGYSNSSIAVRAARAALAKARGGA